MSADIEAWGVLGAAVRGALEVELFEDLDGIIEASTAVVLGTVVGRGPGRTIIGDAEGDVVNFPSLEIRVDRLLVGRLPVGEVGGTIILQVFRVPPDAGMPEHQALLFVRYMMEDVDRFGAIPAPGDEGRYRLTTTQGVVVPDRDGPLRLPVFEVAYGDDVGGEAWVGTPLSRLYENLRTMTFDDLVAAIERR